MYIFYLVSKKKSALFLFCPSVGYNTTYCQDHEEYGCKDFYITITKI